MPGAYHHGAKVLLLSGSFCGARVVRCAAVLFDGEQILYTDGQPAPEIFERFSKRSDNQITTLEVLAIAVGLSTFGEMLVNRRVIIFSDNIGAEGSVRKGASKAWDQSMLIHEIWTLAWKLKMHIWIHRVPSEENISDLPSRESYDLMRDLGLYSDVPIIGYAGSFNAYEGLDDVVRACGALKQQGLVFRLMLIGVELPDHKGAFPVTEGINQLAAEAGLDEWLIMPGLVPHDDVRRWYSLIDIAPFARKSQPVTELVSPIKPLEAMAMGKAVVVSSVRGMEDMVSHGETGQVFPSGDVVALESELHRLLENVSLRQSLGRAARRWVVDKRSWSQSADAMLAAVEPLMGGRS